MLKNGISLQISTDRRCEVDDAGNYVINCKPLNIMVRASFKEGGKLDYSRTHLIFYSSNNQMQPFNWCGNDRECMKNGPHYTCNSSTAPELRYHCGALIRHDGWEIKEDYPW
jgi:hypothetical protein